MSNILNVVARNSELFSPILNPVSNLNPATSFIAAFVQTNGTLDMHSLGAALGRLVQDDPKFVQLMRQELGPDISKLSPMAQGDFERIYNAEAKAAKPKPQASLGTNKPLIGFKPGGIDWPVWIANASKSAPGTPDRVAYDAMVRFGGSKDSKIVEMVMGEVAANNVSLGEIKSATGPLRGGEMRFRIGADLSQIKNQAAFEISVLVPAITALESKPNATARDMQQASELRLLLQPAMNRYALAASAVGSLRASGLVSSPSFADNLIVAEAYRKGGDVLARMGAIKGETVESVASAATRIRDARGPELFDKYIDATISAASLKYIPASITGDNARSNIVRRLGASLEAIKIEVDPAKMPSLPFGNTDGLKADANARFGNSIIEYASLQGVSAADKAALKDGAYEAVGKEFYADTLGMMTAGLASSITAAARGPVKIAADNLVNGKFMGTHNAGPNTPVFANWTQKGGIIELMPGGQIRYTKMINDKTVLSVTNGRAVTVNYKDGLPDFAPFMKHPSGVKSVQIEVTGNQRLDNITANKAAGHPEWGDYPPKGWTWHHHEDAKTMMLIPSEINLKFYHAGGASIARDKP